MLKRIALVSEVKSGVTIADVTRVAAALQAQVATDLAKLWKVQATVSAFATLEDVPLGHWPVILTDKNLGDAAGVHMDKDGQPYALVDLSDSWSLTASHECCEMLVDPFGSRKVAGPALAPAATTAAQASARRPHVEYLLEVCDPCEDARYAYEVNDGVLVSDFYTPQYFDRARASGVRYSCTGAISEPRQVLEGGYLSWHDVATDDWWQRTMAGGKVKDTNLGRLDASKGQSLRELVNGRTAAHLAGTKLAKGSELLAAANESRELSHRSAKARSERLRERIAGLPRKSP